MMDRNKLNDLNRIDQEIHVYEHLLKGFTIDTLVKGEPYLKVIVSIENNNHSIVKDLPKEVQNTLNIMSLRTLVKVNSVIKKELTRLQKKFKKG